MTAFEAQDPGFESRVKASFARQDFMRLIGAELVRIVPGRCEIRLPYRRELAQQHGYFHGGVTGAIADTAAGYAAYSLMPADATILTIEYKINLLAPAEGEELIARARVKRSGRTVTVVGGEVVAQRDDGESQIAEMLATMLCLRGRSDNPRGV